jgi:hypothetical protein
MISPTDLDQLSAYLDGALGAPARAQLEARLAHDPELQAELRALRRAARALRALPTLKPPRHFTLTPAQAGSLPRWWWHPFTVFRLATALSAFLLIFAFAQERAWWGAASAVPIAENYSGATGGDSAHDQSDVPPEATMGMSAYAATPETFGGGAETLTATPSAKALILPTPTFDPSPRLTLTETPAPMLETTMDTHPPQPDLSGRWLPLGLALLTALFAMAAWATYRPRP